MLSDDHMGSGYIWGTKFNIDEGKKKIEKFLTQYNPETTNPILDDKNIQSHYMNKL